jgi:hypothetical protein
MVVALALGAAETGETKMSTTITTTKPGKPRGRPWKFTPATRRRLIAVVAKGVPLTYAAGACGVSRSAFFEFRSSHPRFEEAVQRAIGRAIEKNLDRILTAAKNGDISSAKWYLEKCHSKFFSRQSVELTGEDGQPLAAAVAVYLPAKNAPENAKALPVVTTAAKP